MRRKAKELARMKQEASRTGRTTGLGGGGFGSSSFSKGENPVIDPTPSEPIKSSYTAPRSVFLCYLCQIKTKEQ